MSLPERFDVQIVKFANGPRVSLSVLKRTAGRILKALGWKQAGLSVLLTGDRGIRKLNRRYLGHDRPTDVIAFSQIEGKPLRRHPGRPVFLGDIAISLDTARAQACRYGHRFSYELAFLLCHGVLHLTGADDKTKKQALAMERRQEKILKRIGVFRWPSKKQKHSS